MKSSKICAARASTSKVDRFTTQDPIGIDGGSNLYLYGINPIAWVDPSKSRRRAPLPVEEIDDGMVECTRKK